MDKIKKQFEKFEIDNELHLLNISGYPAWEIVRFFVFQDILIQRGLVKQAIYPKKNIFYILRKSVEILKNIFSLISLILFGKKKIYIFILGHPRRQKQKNGDFYDIYTDFIKEKFKKNNISYVSFEETYFDFYKEIPNISKTLYRLDLIYLVFLIKLKFFNFNKKDLEKINKLEEKLNKKFNVKINLKNRIKRDILLFYLLVKFYNKILKRLGIKKIIEVVGFSIWAKALNYSALKNGIETFELQHGTIFDNLACSLPEYFDGKTLPKNLLTYGKFWNSIIKYPKKQNIKALGFPYLEELLTNIQKENNSKKNILIISQGNISEKLSFFTKKLALKYKGYNFFYKLHPGEFRNDKIIKQNLGKLDNVEIIYDKYNIYELFGKVKTCIGVSSTSLYEAFLFGNKIFIFPLNDGYKVFNLLINENHFSLINLNNLELNFQEEKNNIDYNYFIEKNSLNNILKLIKK